MAEPIEWRVLHHESPRTRWSLAACAGLVFGGAGGLGALAAVAAVGQSRFGVALALLVGSAVAAAALGWYRGARERTPLADAIAVDAAGVRWLPVAGVVAAALVLALPWLGEARAAQLALAGAVAGGLGVLLVQSLRGAGRFDPETGTATVEGRVYDLERAPTWAIPLGGLTILVVRRPVPDLFRRYVVLGMPTRVYGEVARATADAAA